MTALQGPSARPAAGRSARDGSPVELYRLLPTLGEPELIHSAIRPGAEVLELGCGAGRVTRALVALGHPVVAVDESPEMLASVDAGEAVLSRIEDLDLGRTFPAVVLMSNLVNVGDDRQRGTFLEACRRHLDRRGAVLIERLDPGSVSGSFTARYGPFAIEVEQERVGDELSGVVVYSLPDGRHWTHRFERGRILDDEALGEELRAAGLELRRFLDPKRRWCEAVPL